MFGSHEGGGKQERRGATRTRRVKRRRASSEAQRAHIPRDPWGVARLIREAQALSVRTAQARAWRVRYNAATTTNSQAKAPRTQAKTHGA